MANINSLSTNTSSSGSLYGTRNVLSGLASGLDTESLIENSISGYKAKVTQLQQEQEQITWRQDAFRNISDQLSGVLTSFTSYTSKTNLYSESFFESSISTTTMGTYAGKVLATGKSSSDVQINGVYSLASAARYSVNVLPGAINNTSKEIEWEDWNDSTEDQSFTVTFDGSVKKISFSELKDKFESGFDSLSDSEKTKKLAKAMNVVLGKKFGEGRINVFENDGKLNFGISSGASISITSDVPSALGVNGVISNDLSDKKLYQLTGQESTSEWTLEINNVKIADVNATSTMEEVIKAINSSEAGVTASFSPLTGKISFVTKNTGANSEITIGGKWGEKLFLEADPTDVSLKDAFGLSNNAWGMQLRVNVNGDFTQLATFNFTNTDEQSLSALTKWLDEKMNIEVKYQAGKGYSMEAKGSVSVESVSFANVSPGSGKTFSLNDIFNTRGVNSVKGTDAILNATVNGQELTMSRATNTVELDGMSVVLRDTFNMTDDKTVRNKDDAVTFKTNSDTDKVVKAVKDFVDQYNKVLSDVRNAYVTKPLELDSSKHTKYMPLSEEDKSSMSETAVKNYEEKAKTGLLYNDSDLKNLYTQLVNLASSSGSDRLAREAIGITTTYDNGLTQIRLDENALREALEKDPESVKKVFTNEKGDKNTGWMAEVKSLFENYGSTTVSNPGILVKKAGSKLSALSLNNNTLQDQINTLSTKIETWQSKMSGKIDFYTRQFTAMEQMIATMNNQSSMLAGLQGY